MCEPKAGSGLLLLDLALGTKAGRSVLGAAITLGGLYVSTQIMVTVPLIAVVGPAGVAMLAIGAALLYRQRSMASANVANALRQESARRPRIEVQRVGELEAPRPAAALPVIEVRDEVVR